MNPIEKNAFKILRILIENKQDEYINGNEIESLTGLKPIEINDAVAYLEEKRAVDVLAYFGTSPYDFGNVKVTSKGRYLYYDIIEKEKKSAEKQSSYLSAESDDSISSHPSDMEKGLNTDSKSEPTSESDTEPSSGDSFKDGSSMESEQRVLAPDEAGEIITNTESPEKENKAQGKPLDITPYALSDRTSRRDLLGFTVYAQALADFIINDNTKMPITIGIDAPWGMGKTTLMEMICWELINRGLIGVRWCKKCGRCERTNEYIGLETLVNLHLTGDEAGAYIKEISTRQGAQGRLMTVWFNAWKYDNEESLWAALALEILKQIRQQLSLNDQLKMIFQLIWARFDREQFLDSLGKALFFGLIIFISALGVSVLGYEWTVHDLGSAIAKTFQNYELAGLLAVFTLALVTFKDLYKRLVGSFDLNISQYLREPDYRERIGFLSQFEDDFRKVIDITTKWGSKTLVIFIDDLDRCSPPKPAEIIEAINILLDSQHCVFVIGMDGKAVASSIEAKYSDLKNYLDKAGDPAGASLGQRFLDKIIQINFRIPTVELNSMKEFSKKMMPLYTTEKPEAEREGRGTTNIDVENLGAKEQIKTFAEKFDTNPDVQNAIDSVQDYLMSNPRRAKRFLNSYRLLAYIANRRRLLEEGVIRLDLLAKWVVILTRWPDIIDTLETDDQFISILKDAQDLKKSLPTLGQEMERGKADLDVFLSNPRIQRMVDEKEFTELVNQFQGSISNYIHLAKVK